MNKKLHAVHMILLFSAITMVFTGNALSSRKGGVMAAQKGKKVVAQESPAVQVNEELSTIDKIIEQIKRIIKSSGETARKTRAEAKTKINKFMKDLEPQIKQAIEEDVKIILETTDKNKAEAKEAYNRIIETVNVINAQADVINALDNANRAIKLAPAEMKEQVIAEQVQNVQAVEAKAEEMGMMARMTGRVKSALAAPGNYFFGEQRTALKTAVEVTVGLAATGLLTLAAYKLTPEEKRAQLGTYFAEGQKKAGEYYTKAKKYFFGDKKAPAVIDREKSPAVMDGKKGAAADAFRKTSIPKEPEFGEPFLPRELTQDSSNRARRALKKETLKYKEALADALKTQLTPPVVTEQGVTTPKEEMSTISPETQEPTPMTPSPTELPTQQPTPPVVTRQGVTTPKEEMSPAVMDGKKGAAADAFRKTSIPKEPEFGEPFLPRELTQDSSNRARRALKKETLKYKEALADALKTQPTPTGSN